MDGYGTAARTGGPSRRAVLACGLALALAGCQGREGRDALRIMVPTPPGGGFDHTARTVAAVIEEIGAVPDVTVFNLPGSTGTAALARLVYERGAADLLLQMGLGLVANTHVGSASGPVTDATALARLFEEPEALLVPADSEWRSVDDLVDAWRRDPGAMRIAGGSTPAGPDHLVTMLLAEELGIGVADVNYRSYDGGGPVQAALLDDQVDFAAAGPSEQRSAIDSGQLRVLAVTGPERDPGIDAPTLVEAGIGLEFMNWRGLVAPPGLAGEDLAWLLDLVERVHASPEWAERLARNRWRDAYLAGEEFGAFLAEEDERTGRTLERLGLS
ncbi:MULTISPECIES: tripartite tricarboxylate transporter substrate binding protein [unclassified Nocardiopsis]|uniref:Bug family tripartite tricarboxylate transporter substrate binding protein n=1 Tax=unclassified Nocardiopsis TaxID=2649073 RepID=UPI00135CBFB7|nr:MULTISPECIES: tripartite tricarboxylate transporter substrate binding protein [unclassified Nocardiopsis]